MLVGNWKIISQKLIQNYFRYEYTITVHHACFGIRLAIKDSSRFVFWLLSCGLKIRGDTQERERDFIIYLKNTVFILTFTRKSVPILRDSPLFLFESWTASSTLWSTCIVLTTTNKYIWGTFWWCRITSVCMAVAHAPTTDTDVFYWVEILKRNNFVLDYDKIHIYLFIIIMQLSLGRSIKSVINQEQVWKINDFSTYDTKLLII